MMILHVGLHHKRYISTNMPSIHCLVFYFNDSCVKLGILKSNQQLRCLRSKSNCVFFTSGTDLVDSEPLRARIALRLGIIEYCLVSRVEMHFCLKEFYVMFHPHAKTDYCLKYILHLQQIYSQNITSQNTTELV